MSNTVTRVTKNTKKSETKNGTPIPKGATILNKDVRVEVDEIENGFLITKTTEVKFATKERGTDWNYSTQKFFSKEDPLKITTKDSSLADAFDAE